MANGLVTLDLVHEIIPILLIELILILFGNNPAAGTLANPEGLVFFVFPVFVFLDAFVYSVNDFLVCFLVGSWVASADVGVGEQEFVLFKLMVQIFMEHKSR